MMNRLTPMTSSTIRFGNQNISPSVPAQSIFHAQVRFGNGGQAAESEKIALDTLARASEWVFTRKEAVGDLITKNLINKGGGWEFLGKILKPVTDKVLEWDYQTLQKLPRLGSVVVEPPIGALIILLYGFTLMGRLSHALHRAIGGDRRELRDIAIRDLPTFSIILFALNPMVNLLSRFFQGKTAIFGRHIKLFPDVKGQGAFSYSALKDLYTVQSQENLAEIIKLNKADPKGLLNALENTAKKLGTLVTGNKEQYEPVATAFDAYHQALKTAADTYHGAIKTATDAYDQAVKAAGKSEAGKAVITKAKETLKAAIAEADEALSPGAATAFNKLKELEVAKAGLATGLKDHLPSFPEIFASYAKGSRVWANILSYALVIAALGYGVTSFNKWITEREYKKLKENGGEQGQAQTEGLSQSAEGMPAEAAINPMAQTMAPSFEPQVSQYPQYAQYPQYPTQSAYGYSNPYSGYPQQAYSPNIYASNPWNATAYPQTYPYGYYQ